MTPPLPLPGGRVLHGWWRELAPLAPRRVWFAQLAVHRVEVLGEVSTTTARGRLATALLGLLARRPAPVSPAEAAGDLALDLPLAAALFDDLTAAGLLEPVGDRWAVRSPAAGNADGPTASGTLQRRTFYFTDDTPPGYVPLKPDSGVPFTPPDEWAAAVQPVADALAQQPAGWKQAHGFPTPTSSGLVLPADVAAVDAGEQRRSTSPSWPRLVLVETDLAGWWRCRRGRTAGRAGGRPEGRSAGGQPARCPGARGGRRRSVAAGVARLVSATKSARRRRGRLPAGAVGHRLQVRAPARLVDRLRLGAGATLARRAWLLAGTGRVRAAAQIELVGA
ncbi:MAG: hypothetical protein U0736_23070 [Gemmataceae bacterium]